MIFKLETLLVGSQFEISNYPNIPLVAFNPAAYIKDNKLVILPRLCFDNRFYVSSIGLTEPLEFSNLANYKKIKTKLIRYPLLHNEIGGVEDPRITEDGLKILTVGVGKNGTNFTSQTMMSNFDGEKIVNTKPFLFRDTELQTGRDAVLLNDHVLLFRPESKYLKTYKAFYTENSEYVIISDKNLMILPSLSQQVGEKKRGLSTNIVKLSSNEYIMGYHVVFNEKTEYKNGFILLDDNGETIRTSKLMLEASGVLRYGHRPFTLFGCGLVLWKEKLYWVGGIGDSFVGIFSCNLDEVLANF